MLKPGAEYEYLNQNGTTYAREVGTHPGDWQVIGQIHDPKLNNKTTFLGLPIEQVSRLVDIQRAAEQNVALQDALDRVIMIYELVKSNDQTPPWYPV